MDISSPPNKDLKDANSVYQELPSNLPYETAPDIIDVGDIRADERNKVMRRYAVLSSIAYDMYNHGYDKANENLKEFLPYHNLDDELSDKNSIVAVKEHTNKKNDVIISYRGTDPFNLSDDVSDLQILAGLPISKNFHLQGRFQEAQNKYNLVKSKYPNENIITTGHSLGGTQAYLIGKRNNINSYVFNAGSSPLDKFTGSFEDTESNQSTHYYVTGDIIGGSRAIYNNDKLVKVEPHKWVRDLIGSMGLGYINPVLGVASATASALYDLHGLHNFLPTEAFKEELEPSDILYRWISPLHYEMKAEQRLQKNRSNLVNFSQKENINRKEFIENYKRCLNPYNPKCQLKRG